MSAIQTLRKSVIRDTPLTNKVYTDGETLLNVITKHPQFDDCIIEHHYSSFEGKLYEFSERGTYLCDHTILSTLTELGMKAYFRQHFAFSAEVENRSRDTYNERGGKDKVWISVIYTETKEEVHNVFFVKNKQLSYSSGSSVKLLDTTIKNEQHQHFYGEKEGIGRYAAMGGNMD